MYVVSKISNICMLSSNLYKSQDENGNTFLRILLPLDEVVKHLVSPCYQLYVRRGCKKYGQALIELHSDQLSSSEAKK